MAGGMAIATMVLMPFDRIENAPTPRRTKILAILAVAGILPAALIVSSMDTRPAGAPGEPSFRADVLPILVAGGCANCHGDDGGLAVTSVRALLAGGDNGPAVVPGHADSSGLVRAIVADSPFGPRMPPEGPPLAQGSIDTIRAWIDAGAKEN